MTSITVQENEVFTENEAVAYKVGEKVYIEAEVMCIDFPPILEKGNFRIQMKSKGFMISGKILRNLKNL